MKFNDYEVIIGQLLDDNLRSEAIVSLTDLLKADEAKYNSINNEIKELTESNTKLRDTNSKLALRVTGLVEAPEEEKTLDEIKDEWIKKARA